MNIADYIGALKEELDRRPSIGFLGLGTSNLALISSSGVEDCNITLRSDTAADTSGIPDGVSIARILSGEHALDDIDEDALFLSPSTRRDRPELVQAANRGVRLTSDAELFFKNGPGGVYAVTGSDGKSTSVTLAARLLSEKYGDVEPIGNIGSPFATAKADAVYVAELSSFQLMYLKPVLSGALITSISENHLDWHSSFDEYKAAKLAITENAERIVFPADDSTCCELLGGKKVYAVYSRNYTYCELKQRFSALHYVTEESGDICVDGVRWLGVSDCRRREWYNVCNLMGAMALCYGHYSREWLVHVAGEFGGLPHRAEMFLNHDGIDFVNSSIDTSPSRTRATLTALGHRVRIILGGRGKKLPLGICADALQMYAQRISLYGEAGREYYDELSSLGFRDRIPLHLYERFDDAVEDALVGVARGDTVLLSPAATGYGQFRNYAERGDHFKEYIKHKYKQR